jgi:hypothetical protein
LHVGGSRGRGNPSFSHRNPYFLCVFPILRRRAPTLAALAFLLFLCVFFSAPQLFAHVTEFAQKKVVLLGRYRADEDEDEDEEAEGDVVDVNVDANINDDANESVAPVEGELGADAAAGASGRRRRHHPVTVQVHCRMSEHEAPDHEFHQRNSFGGMFAVSFASYSVSIVLVMKSGICQMIQLQ